MSSWNMVSYSRQCKIPFMDCPSISYRFYSKKGKLPCIMYARINGCRKFINLIVDTNGHDVC